jgi:hypothetical protein
MRIAFCASLCRHSYTAALSGVHVSDVDTVYLYDDYQTIAEHVITGDGIAR